MSTQFVVTFLLSLKTGTYNTFPPSHQHHHQKLNQLKIVDSQVPGGIWCEEIMAIVCIWLT